MTVWDLWDSVSTNAFVFDYTAINRIGRSQDKILMVFFIGAKLLMSCDISCYFDTCYMSQLCL